MRKGLAGRTFLVTTVVGLALIGSPLLARVAGAQEKPAATTVEAPGSRIHGFFDAVYKNDYITPRGLLVTDTGSTVQQLMGLVFSLYNDPKAPISSVSLVTGVWNDVWTEQNHKRVGSWNEFDWFVGLNATVAETWKLGVTMVQFLSPPGNFKTETNIEFMLGYDDSTWGLPITINPYVKPFWAVSGDSTVVVGRKGGTADVEIGIVPTLELKKFGIPLTVLAPTWFTAGPKEYWNGGDAILKCTTCSASNTGVVSTGLTLKTPLSFIPASFGHWSLRGGVQYFHILNDNLLYAQNFTRGLAFTPGVPSSSARRDIPVYFVGLGFDF